MTYAGHPGSELPAQLLPTLNDGEVGPIGDTASELAHVVMGYEQAARWRADVIHDHTLAGPLAGRSRVPVVVTNHGPFTPLTNPIFAHVARRASVVAISHDQASSATSVPLAGVVHHGIDVTDWPLGDGVGGYAALPRPDAPEQGRAPGRRAASAAGVPLVLAAKMREQAEVDYFNNRVRPLLHDHAVFVGEADAAMKRQLLAGAHALLNPIAWPEPFGMVMVEALACGTPVITSPCGAAPEIVDHGQTGFLCRTRAEYLAAIDVAPSLDRRHCRASVAERFPVERMVESYERLYRELAVDRKRIPIRFGQIAPSIVQLDGSPRTVTASGATVTPIR